MDYAPNPGAHLLPPTKRTRYPAPSIVHWPPDSSIPRYNAPPTAHASSTPLSHLCAPPFRTTPPPPPHNYTSTVASGYSVPMPVENPPLTDIPHYVVPEAYSRDINVVQQSAPRQSYGFSSAYYTSPTSHYSKGYDPYPDPYATHSAHPGSGYSVSGYSYQRPAYQFGGYDPDGYPQVHAGNGDGTNMLVSNQLACDHGIQISNTKRPNLQKPIIIVGYPTRQGKKHQRNLGKLQGAITPMIGPQPKGTDDLPKSPSQPSERKRKSYLRASPQTTKKGKKKCTPTVSASLEKLEVKKKRVYDAGAPVDGVRVCGVCNIVVNSQKVFDLHCAGSKHVMMLKRLQEGS
ncbi:zinc finger RNA-binding protein-like isoform X2 [Carex littledalei]|uniref:Zinc finger RNA-binding protein-like isoform X2 n=1 Tax=Carex littledalei TaxID=544730 RepID=A0A833VHB5_9POAL|nr:zinc finger RNA-binding protein-like isoform X2 [Carex littledalei]